MTQTVYDEPMAATQVQVQPSHPALTAADRCDACSAAAYVRAHLTTGQDLQFCGHHWRESEQALLPMIASVQDERSRLTPTP